MQHPNAVGLTLSMTVAACGFVKSNAPDSGTGAKCGGSGTISFTGTNGVNYSDPGCWIFHLENSGTPPTEGELDSPNSGNSPGSASFFFPSSDQNTNAPCPWSSGTTVQLSSQCIGGCVDWDDAMGEAWSACVGYQATSGGPLPMGSLTVTHWPASAADTLTFSLSAGAQFPVVQSNDDCSPSCENAKYVTVSGSVTSPSDE
jgi:hypothetical protein